MGPAGPGAELPPPTAGGGPEPVAVGGTAVGFAGVAGGAVGVADGGADAGVCVEGLAELVVVAVTVVVGRGGVGAFASSDDIVVETVGPERVKVGCVAASWYVPPSAFNTPLAGTDCSIIA
jgi:hypothetical protein